MSQVSYRHLRTFQRLIGDARKIVEDWQNCIKPCWNPIIVDLQMERILNFQNSENQIECVDTSLQGLSLRSHHCGFKCNSSSRSMTRSAVNVAIYTAVELPWKCQPRSAVTFFIEKSYLAAACPLFWKTDFTRDVWTLYRNFKMSFSQNTATIPSGNSTQSKKTCSNLTSKLLRNVLRFFGLSCKLLSEVHSGKSC